MSEEPEIYYREEIARLRSERNWFAVGFVVLYLAWFLTIVAAG